MIVLQIADSIYDLSHLFVKKDVINNCHIAYCHYNNYKIKPITALNQSDDVKNTLDPQHIKSTLESTRAAPIRRCLQREDEEPHPWSSGHSCSFHIFRSWRRGN